MQASSATALLASALEFVNGPRVVPLPPSSYQRPATRGAPGAMATIPLPVAVPVVRGVVAPVQVRPALPLVPPKQRHIPTQIPRHIDAINAVNYLFDSQLTDAQGPVSIGVVSGSSVFGVGVDDEVSDNGAGDDADTATDDVVPVVAPMRQAVVPLLRPSFLAATAFPLPLPLPALTHAPATASPPKTLTPTPTPTTGTATLQQQRKLIASLTLAVERRRATRDSKQLELNRCEEEAASQDDQAVRAALDARSTVLQCEIDVSKSAIAKILKQLKELQVKVGAIGVGVGVGVGIGAEADATENRFVREGGSRGGEKALI